MCRESVAFGLSSIQSGWCWMSALTHMDASQKHICALFQSWQPGLCPSFDAVLTISEPSLNEDQANSIFLQQDESIGMLGAEGHFLFSSLDTDHDLYLSPEEFKPIAEKLTGMPLLLLPTRILHPSLRWFFSFLPPEGIITTVDFEEEETNEPDRETFTVEAKLQPLLLDSMTKSKDGFLGVRWTFLISFGVNYRKESLTL